MRQVGVCDNEEHAVVFTDYLLTQGVLAQAEEDGENKWSVWVRDEDHLELARDEFGEYLENPADPRYHESRGEADSIRREAVRRHEERRKNTIHMRDTWRGGSGRKAPLTFLLIAASVGVTMLTNYGDAKGPLLSNVSFNHNIAWDPESGLPPPIIEPGASAFADVLKGQVWRLVTPIFLHMTLFHLVANAYWTFVFGSRIEARYKSWWLLWLVVLFAVCSNAAQAYYYGPGFGGMSGVGYGLFGYIWMKSLFDPKSNLRLDQFTIIIFIVWFFLCMSGKVGNIANLAHGVGLVVGVAAGYLPTIFVGRRQE